MRQLFLLACVLFFLPARTVHADPLNTWGEFVGKRVFALTPYVYAGPSFGVQPWVYGEWGFTDHFEVATAVAATVAPGQAFDALEIMPRYFWTETEGLALRATWTPSTSSAVTALEFHGVYRFGSLGLTLNPTWAPIVGSTGFDLGQIGGIFAPEWYFTDTFSAFIELTPLFDVAPSKGNDADRWSAEVVPGISFEVGELHSFSMGIGVPVAPFDPNEIYGGMWYSVFWGGEDEGGADAAPTHPTALSMLSGADRGLRPGY